MKTKILSFSIVFSAIIISFFIISGDKIFAQNEESNIQFPIAELGNCQDKQDCKIYCDKPENLEACVSFAETNNLMDKKEAQVARKIAKTKGPGGCANKKECEEYCDAIDRIDECIAFAEQNGLMEGKELEEAKKVKSAKARGVKMPACQTKKECDVYCESPNHMEECITFAMEAGLMEESEREEAQKVLVAVKKGIKPPQCGGKKECDTYCSQENHFEECIAFAEAAGFMKPEEIKMARKTGGKGPGNCRGKEECDQFCEKEENFPICIEFALQHGLMKPEEAEMARKTGGKGPGNCRGKEECEAFCNNPDNQETCFNFGKEHGLISEEDLKKMDEGKRQFMDNMNQAPPEVLNCLKEKFGEEKFESFKSGQTMPSRETGDIMRQCFEQNMRPNINGLDGQSRDPQGFPFEFNSMPLQVKDCLVSTLGQDAIGRLQSGDVGSINMEQAKSCFQNMSLPSTEFIQRNDAGMNQPDSFQRGPGGCSNPEECRKYCESNLSECGFQEGSQRQSMPRIIPEGQMPPRLPDGSFPRDYRPESGPGMQLPPEAFNRPPEGSMPQGGYPTPPEGYQQMPLQGDQAQPLPQMMQLPPLENLQQQQPPQNIQSPPPSQESLPAGSMLAPESLMGFILGVMGMVF